MRDELRTVAEERESTSQWRGIWRWHYLGLGRPAKQYNGFQLVGSMFRIFLKCENQVRESDRIFWAWKYVRCTDHLQIQSRIIWFVQPGRVGLKPFIATFLFQSGRDNNFQGHVF